MTRLVWIVTAIALLPAPTDAQARAASSRTHTVTRGDTLSGIAARYLGAASEWPRVFDANQDHLVSPHMLRVGEELTIPEAETSTPSPAPVTSVQIVGAAERPQEVLSYEVRRRLLESRFFEPIGIPRVPVGERSVFFDVPEPQAQAAIVVLEGVQQTPTFPISVFHAAGWLLPEGNVWTPLATIIGFADGRGDTRSTSGLLYEEVYLRFSTEQPIRLGEELLAYEIARSIPGVGDVAVPSGTVRVIEVVDGEAVGQIVQAFGQVGSGHFVARAPDFPLEPGVRPAQTDSDLETRILAMQDRKEIYLPGDFAFVEQAPGMGLGLGDELRALAADDDDWGDPDLARFQVVGLQGDVATVRLLSSLVPSVVRPGLRLMVDRKMP